MKTVFLDSKVNAVIGRVGEHGVTRVIFCLDRLIHDYGEGNAQLVFIAPETSSPVICVTHREGNELIWPITASETNTKGRGKVEVRWYVGESLAKSEIYHVTVIDSINTPTSDMPEDVGDWVGEATEKLAEFEEAISKVDDHEERIKTLEDAEITQGADGKSAYELAVEAGYDGTLEQWLESLKGAKGDPGDDGKSAYDLAVASGYTGTLDEFLAYLHGEDGMDGEDGSDGKSAYELAVQNGFVGTLTEWLASLKGEPGEKGDKGDDATVSTELNIILQPVDIAVTEGESANFSVVCENAVSYQWYYKPATSENFSKSSMTGATTTTLSVLANTSRNGQSYKCLIKNADGSQIWSNVATITVKAKSSGSGTTLTDGQKAALEKVANSTMITPITEEINESVIVELEDGLYNFLNPCNFEYVSFFNPGSGEIFASSNYYIAGLCDIVHEEDITIILAYAYGMMFSIESEGILAMPVDVYTHFHENLSILDAVNENAIHEHSNKEILDSITAESISNKLFVVDVFYDGAASIPWSSDTTLEEIVEALNSGKFVVAIAHWSAKTTEIFTLSNAINLGINDYRYARFYNANMSRKLELYNGSWHTTEYEFDPHMHNNKDVLDGITEEKVAEWDNKQDTDIIYIATEAVEGTDSEGYMIFRCNCDPSLPDAEELKNILMSTSRRAYFNFEGFLMEINFKDGIIDGVLKLENAGSMLYCQMWFNTVSNDNYTFSLTVLPLPKLTFTGAVDAEWNGTEDVEIEIPSGGSDNWELILDSVLEEDNPTSNFDILFDDSYKKVMCCIDQSGCATCSGSGRPAVYGKNRTGWIGTTWYNNYKHVCYTFEPIGGFVRILIASSNVAMDYGNGFGGGYVSPIVTDDFSEFGGIRFWEYTYLAGTKIKIWAVK